jgi:hypothetical protein
MPRIIRESYENGVLIERKIKGSTFNARKWLMLFAHLVIILAVLAALAVHDNLALGCALLHEETSAASCEQPGFRS